LVGRLDWNPVAPSDSIHRLDANGALQALDSRVTQVANVLACRSETRPVSVKGILSNRVLVAGVLIELLVIAGIDYTPWGHRIFGTAPIGWTPWLVALPFAMALLALDGLWKNHRRRIHRSCPAEGDNPAAILRLDNQPRASRP
jgi:hypothetical protein